MLASLAVLMAVPMGRAQAPGPSHGTMIAELEDGFCLGAAVGPDGAIYVGNLATASIVRVDATTGATSTVATGLPTGDFDGPTHIVFIGSTMYVLTTGEEAGIYRIDAGTPVLVADIAAFNLANPPETDPGDLIPTGNPFGIDVLGDGDFIVVDANFNRLLRVNLAGEIEIIASFGNVVPTRVQPTNASVFMSEIGPFPHTPETGVLSSVNLATGSRTVVASGVPNIIDVEFGPGGKLFVISFGVTPEDAGEEDPPAVPFTGQLLVVNGEFIPLVTSLLLPVSLDFIGNSAFIVTLNCQVWRIDNVSGLVTALTPTATATATATATPSPTTPATATATTAPATATPGPPATGSGFTGGGSDNWWLVPATASLLLAAAGMAATFRRRPATER